MLAQLTVAQEPLLEEYSVAAHVSLTISLHLFTDADMMTVQIYKFSQASLAELARNSVIQSGFEMQVKRHWIGHHWYLPGAAGNDINRVRYARMAYFGQEHSTDVHRAA